MHFAMGFLVVKQFLTFRAEADLYQGIFLNPFLYIPEINFKCVIRIFITSD